MLRAATSAATAGLGALGVGGGAPPGSAALQDVCTCAHAEAGLRAAMLACGKKADGSAELVQALTLQVRQQRGLLDATRGVRLRSCELTTRIASLLPTYARRLRRLRR